MDIPGAVRAVHTRLQSIGYRPGGALLVESTVLFSSVALHSVLRQAVRLLIGYGYPPPPALDSSTAHPSLQFALSFPDSSPSMINNLVIQMKHTVTRPYRWTWRCSRR